MSFESYELIDIDRTKLYIINLCAHLPGLLSIITLWIAKKPYIWIQAWKLKPYGEL